MPKYNIIIKPGEKISEDLNYILKGRFNEKSIEKLRRFGGRIQISLTAPFTDRKQQKKQLIVDHNLIEKLTKSTESTTEILQRMTLKQIKEVAKYVNFPIASKVTVEDARKQLISFLFSNDTWNKISK
jgi:hypothetical protein